MNLRNNMSTSKLFYDNFPLSIRFKISSSIKYLVFLILLFFVFGCSGSDSDLINSEDTVPEKTIKDELLSIAFVKCTQEGGDSMKLLEAYIFVDKLFSKSSGDSSIRDRITYRKSDAKTCRENLLIYPATNCDFKPFDFNNYISDKAFCNLEPTSYFN
ncbi:hypothetical protein [Leptospira sp. GIMC2001]|uniref:hypothetical protein n=1 Tax=Leptospira sp. GIMC2001 TaxID=1513297 RepID=UPI0023498819|nr:hypothetical protein [Leptospira sp. GIMC2001]WCL50575.1 hypothetical protein O4O04_07090 [Leptospira sp. GIMC2001]